MSTLPSAAAVTTPDGDTVARTGFDDCHVERLVTSTVVPSLRVAIANSCRVSPDASAADPLPGTPTCTPVTVTDGAPDGAAGAFEPLQAMSRPSAREPASSRMRMKIDSVVMPEV